MKKNLLNGLLATCMLLFAFAAGAQAPGSFNYQGIARNGSGTPLASKVITIQVSIVENSADGTIIYTETHDTIRTTSLGYFNIHVGDGIPTYSAFGEISWGNGHSKWLQVSIDPDGGTNFTLMGSSQLVSVPFALYAAKAASTNLSGQAPLSVSNNVVKINAGTTAGDLLSWDGNNWVAKQPTTSHLPDTTINNMQPYLALTYCIALQGVFPSRDGLDPYLGEIALFPYNFVPRGWAACNGQLLPISQNQALFALLGTNYGGNGVTVFALPDLRGRVPIHIGQGAGLQNYQLSQQGGTETNTIHR